MGEVDAGDSDRGKGSLMSVVVGSCSSSCSAAAWILFFNMRYYAIRAKQRVSRACDGHQSPGVNLTFMYSRRHSSMALALRKLPNFILPCYTRSGAQMLLAQNGRVWLRVKIGQE